MAFRPGFTPAQTLILALVVILAIAALGMAAVLLFFSPPSAAPAIQPPASTPALLPSPTSTLSPTSLPTQAPPLVESPLPTATPLAQACLPPDGERSQARVSAVLDGATIQAELNGQLVTVRYLGVDPAGPGGALDATALNRSLVEGQTVELVKDVYDTDAQGRLLRYVLAGDVFVNYALVRQGAALAALYPPGISCAETLVAAGQQARAARLGFWASTPQSALPAAPTSSPVDGAQASPCDCNRTYACTDFASRAAAQACYDACGDYRNAGLDADHNGLACENLP